jgi:hypothetical protein
MEKLQLSTIPFEANMNVCSDFDINFLQAWCMNGFVVR